MNVSVECRPKQRSIAEWIPALTGLSPARLISLRAGLMRLFVALRQATRLCGMDPSGQAA